VQARFGPLRGSFSSAREQGSLYGPAGKPRGANGLLPLEALGGRLVAMADAPREELFQEPVRRPSARTAIRVGHHSAWQGFSSQL
jgi:hypothetical protein